MLLERIMCIYIHIKYDKNVKHTIKKRRYLELRTFIVKAHIFVDKPRIFFYFKELTLTVHNFEMLTNQIFHMYMFR